MKHKTTASIVMAASLIGSASAGADTAAPSPRSSFLKAVANAGPSADPKDHASLREAPQQNGALRALLGGSSVKLSGPMTVGGDVYFARYSPDGATVVYAADQHTDDIFELYSVPADGSAGPTKISGVMLGGPGSGVSGFMVSSDGLRVVYQATQDNPFPEIYSVPIGGPAASAIKLSGTPFLGFNGSGPFGISADGSRVGYLADQDTGGMAEAYSVPIDGSAAPCKLNAPLQGSGNVVATLFAADSARLVYSADQDLDEAFELYSAPSDCSAAPTKLNPALAAFSAVSRFRISEDSTRVVYAADQNTPGVQELFSVPIAGPAAAGVQLSGPADFFSNVVELAISPDGVRVVYRADLTRDELFEVHSVPIAGPSGSSVRLSDAMPLGAFGSTTLNIDSTAGWVTYEADQNAAFEFELYSVPIDGSSSSVPLHGIGTDEDVGLFGGVGTPIIGGRVFYPVFGPAGADLFSVPVDGSRSPVQLNSPMAAGGGLFSAFLPTEGGRLVSYAGETDSIGVIEAYETTANGSLTPAKINDPLVAGGNLADPPFANFGAGFNSTETFGLYIADQDTDEVYELYTIELDSDRDGTPNTTDNCRFRDNPAQGPVFFDQTITAPSRTELEWPSGADVNYVRGNLSTVASYAIDDSGALTDATALIDATLPGVRTGWWYLVAAGGDDCPAASWQTTSGGQPDRDLNLP